MESYRDLISRLDDEQRAVTLWRPDQGNLRIQATAGSGKTTTLTALAATLIQEAAWPAARMVVTTFSRKAADEIASRLLRVIDPGATPLMSTWHGLALKTMRAVNSRSWKINRCTELPISKRDADVPSNRQIWRTVTGYQRIPVIGKKGLDTPKLTNAYMDQHLLDTAEGRKLFDGVRESDPPRYLTAWKMFDEYKRAIGVWDWDDLLYAWLHRLEQNPRKHPLLVLVDEAQDNSRVQLNIAQKLASHPEGRLILVGDSRQAIHTWRGAYPELFLEAETRLKAVTRYLHNTYRCPAFVVRMANALVDGEGWADGPAAGSFRDLEGKTTFRREDVTKEVAGRVKAGANPLDIAILARTNAEVGKSTLQLLAAGCNARAQGGGNILRSPVAQDILGWLEVANGCLTKDGWFRVYRSPLRFLSKAWATKVWGRMQQGIPLVSAISDCHSRSSGYGSLLKDIRDLRALDASEGFNLLQTQILFIAKKILKLQTTKGLDATDKNRRRNEERARDDRIAAAMAELAGTFDTLDRFKDLQTLAEKKGEPAVTVSTMHRSKGLEWPVVYVMAEAKKVPLQRGDPDEEKRLFYVAITRAREELHCLFQDAPSPYIIDYLPALNRSDLEKDPTND